VPPGRAVAEVSGDAGGPGAGTSGTRFSRSASDAWFAAPPRVIFAVYADSDGFCPEVFKRAALEAGETVTWSATYRFV